MALFELRLLGPPTLLRDGAPVDLERRCALALVAYLAVETDGAHTCMRRDDLAALFWPDADAERARSSLRRTLAALTKGFAGMGVAADRESICLSRLSAGSELRVDIERFRSLLSHCHHYGRPADSVCEHCLLPLIEAAALYRGDFMSGFTLPGSTGFDDWQRTQSDNLRCELAGVLSKLVTGMTERRNDQQAIGYAQRWVALDPLYEPAQRSLMQLYTVAGQPQMALRQYLAFAAMLEHDLGVSPQHETYALYQAIRNDRALVATVIQPVLPGLTTIPTQPRPADAQPKHAGLPAHLQQAPLVGREFALIRALDGWQRVRAGAVQALLISGEPGIGKTHFTRALVQAVSASGDKALQAHCAAHNESTCAPIAQWIRDGIVDTGGTGNAPKFPASVLSDLIRLAPDLHADFTDIAPNPPLGPQAEQQHLFGSIYAMCDALTEEGARPLAFVVDDIQWADGGTLHLLRYLAERAAQSRRRFWLIMTHAERSVDPSESPILHDLLLHWQRAHLLDEIKLARLDRQQTRSMLASMLPTGGEVSDEFLDTMYAQSEGHPFFIDEFCRALLDEGRIYCAEGRWYCEELAAIAIPPLVRAAVLARVARLSPVAQDVLRQAAIIGPAFAFDLLQRASGVEEGLLVAALEQAGQQQLIEENAWRGALVYGFVHMQIPVILCDSLSGPRRRQLLRRAAAAVEYFQPDCVEGLVQHETVAGEPTLSQP